jgi:dihydroorotase-like cyclic amidohydrolase
MNTSTADIAIKGGNLVSSRGIDPDTHFTIPPKNPHLNVDYSMYDGRQGKGVPITTILRGKIMMEDGVILGSGGEGQFVGGKQIEN